MNKFKISAFVLSLFMVACSSDDEIITNEEKTIEVISAEIIQPEEANGTRVIIEGNPGDAIRPLRWRADDPNTKANEADVIYVYDSEGNAARFVYSETEDASKGIFKRDVNIGNPIKDVKNALCVTTGVGRKGDLPTSITDTFKFLTVLMHHRGGENAPMYGEMGADGILKFQPLTGILELVVDNYSDIINDPVVKAKNQFAIKLVARDENGHVKHLSDGDASIDFENKTLKLPGLANDTDCLMLMVNEISSLSKDDNRFYFPLVTGQYSEIKITIHPLNAYKPAMTEEFIIKPKSGTITIDKKLYSVSKAFTIK